MEVINEQGKKKVSFIAVGEHDYVSTLHNWVKMGGAYGLQRISSLIIITVP